MFHGQHLIRADTTKFELSLSETPYTYVYQKVVPVVKCAIGRERPVQSLSVELLHGRDWNDPSGHSPLHPVQPSTHTWTQKMLRQMKCASLLSVHNYEYKAQKCCTISEVTADLNVAKCFTLHVTGICLELFRRAVLVKISKTCTTF